MSNDKKNLLEELLTATNGDSKEAKDLLDFIEDLASDIQGKELKNKKKICEITSRKKKKIIKRTYYLRQELISLLNKAEDKLKQIKQSKKDFSKKRVTKSKIVNLALELLLSDFAAKGEESFLFRRLFLKNVEKD